MLHVERAHRTQLEANLKILKSLVTAVDEPILRTVENLADLLDAVLVSGREARHLDIRYNAMMYDGAISVAALGPEDIPALIQQAIDRSLFGFSDWLSEQRPDLKQAIRRVRVDDNVEHENS